MALKEVIAMQGLLTELVDRKLLDEVIKPKIKCKAFEDNSGALELATMPKVRPRTKHINVKYHHFRSHVKAKMIEIESVSSKALEQWADIFTKPLPPSKFIPIRRNLCGY